MIVRFGYVAMSMIVPNASPSKTMTVTSFLKLADREAAVRKLERIAEENLANTLRLLRHNRAYEVHLYRFSSKLVPLIGHEMLEDWNPYPMLEPGFREIGNYVKEHGMRVSFHPDHFTVLSTPREDVLRNSFADLDRHVQMLDLMGLDETAKCNIHIGGAYGNKEAAIDRFIINFNQMDEHIKSHITLENDDKTFTAVETLGVCEKLGIPMVLDIHHHLLNSGGEELNIQLWERIANTWKGHRLSPKIHVSSPKSEKDQRGHADYVEEEPLLRFLRMICDSTPNIDVMIEAKKKDASVFRLVEKLKRQEDVKLVDQTTIEVSLKV